MAWLDRNAGQRHLASLDLRACLAAEHFEGNEPASCWPLNAVRNDDQSSRGISCVGMLTAYLRSAPDAAPDAE